MTNPKPNPNSRYFVLARRYSAVLSAVYLLERRKVLVREFTRTQIIIVNTNPNLNPDPNPEPNPNFHLNLNPIPNLSPNFCRSSKWIAHSAAEFPPFEISSCFKLQVDEFSMVP